MECIKLSFKNFINEEVVVKTPKPYKSIVLINIQEYYELVNKSKLKLDKKLICSNLLSQKKDIPIYSEEDNKFFMLSLHNNQAREVKSREDKQMCGALYNALLITEANNTEKLEKLKLININWVMPNLVISNI